VVILSGAEGEAKDLLNGETLRGAQGNIQRSRKNQRKEISMKRLYSVLIAMAMLVIFVPTAALAAGASGFPTWSQHLTKGRFTVLPLF
jgi:uncharacterized membrane-anchored protein YitT (DUF2179 family)